MRHPAHPLYSGPVHQALADHLRRHALRTGDFVLRSGARSDWYVDARATTFTGEGAALVAEAVLGVLAPRGDRPRAAPPRGPIPSPWPPPWWAPPGAGR